MSIRTDLATELKDDLGYLPEGVEYHKITDKRFTISRICIKDSTGARAMKKPVGQYITLDTQIPIARLLPRERARLAKKAAQELSLLIGKHSKNTLIVGLGNRMVTADSLGPKVCGDVFVTRHILNHLPDFLDERTSGVCTIAPEVLGVTGLESFEVVKGIVREISPALVIVIDSLAARNVERLGASIQLTDTGISPGAGMNNHREELSETTLHVPVIGIGVPTVVYTGTILSDMLEQIHPDQNTSAAQRMIRKISSVRNSDLVVTPKDIDILTDYAAKVIAEMLDYALNPYISRAEIEDIRS